jgi:predicted nucleotidyltransferase
MVEMGRGSRFRVVNIKAFNAFKKHQHHTVEIAKKEIKKPFKRKYFNKINVCFG